MSKRTLFVGIDISKERLEVFFQGKSFELLNQPSPLVRFMRQLLALEVPLQLICEARGGYEEPLLQSAHPLGCPSAVFNPLG
jgi:hypothetical protein